MTKNFEVSYAITRTLTDSTVESARARVTEALKAEGFGVLTEIDLRATLEKKIGATIEPYVILGACNPHLAHKAVSAEPAAGLLLPCNVVVAQRGADVVLSAIAPRAMFSVMEDASAIEDIAADAEARLRRAIERA
jgi:uncharacterized protein (DUF302 family)